MTCSGRTRPRLTCWYTWLRIGEASACSSSRLTATTTPSRLRHFVKSLPDEAIDVHIARAAEAPSELSLMHLYPIDGAVHRVAQDATAWTTRDATWSMVIAGIDADAEKAGALKTWGRDYWRAIHPFNLAGAYVNFMMDDELQGRVQATYGENYQRLSSVKARYDPENLFRVNQNIVPASLA